MEDILVGCSWRCIRNAHTLLNIDQKRVFSYHCYVGDRGETSQWLSRLQHTPAQLCVAKARAEISWQAGKSFSGEARRRFGGCPTPWVGVAAELRLPHLATDHLSYAATTLQVPVPGHQPHWPRPRPTSQAGTGTASSLRSHLVPLHSGWPSYCLWACLKQESLTGVLGFTSALPYHQELVWPLLNLGWTPFSSEPCSCLQTHPAWILRDGAQAGEPPMLPGLLACSALAPQCWWPAIPCWGWQSRWNWEYRPDAHKIKVWHRVRALLSWEKNPRASC